MTGPNPRRTSGEVINATLLEVFLALAFILFGLADFEQRRALSAETILEASPSVDALQSEASALAAARDTIRKNTELYQAARDTINKLRSPIQPDCEPGGVPAALVTLTLIGQGQMRVQVNRSVADLTAGETFTVASEAFRQRFSAVLALSAMKGCRFIARIEGQNAPEVTKTDLLASLSSIGTVFRPRNVY
jgi:hypothetical protein